MKKGRWFRIALLGLLLLPQHASRDSALHETPSGVVARRVPAIPGAHEGAADFAGEAASDEVRHVAHWAVDARDNGDRPFVIVDKTEARVYVFEASGRLRGVAPALLGLAHGDHSVPGIGQRPVLDIRPHERTTPAGRFVAEPGRNLHGEDILWVDYDAAVSMHRVRPINPVEQRLERLASATPDDNRISYGCINLPAAFYDTVLKPTLGGAKAIVYVLPETRPAQEVFGSYDVAERRRGQSVAVPGGRLAQAASLR